MKTKQAFKGKVAVITGGTSVVGKDGTIVIIGSIGSIHSPGDKVISEAAQELTNHLVSIELFGAYFPLVRLHYIICSCLFFTQLS